MFIEYNGVIIAIVFRPTLISSYSRYAGKTTLAKMMALFFLMGMIPKETHYVPVQSLPFSVYPW